VTMTLMGLLKPLLRSFAVWLPAARVLTHLVGRAAVVQINTTVFAYGATGSGKTYTMVGSHNDPGLMVLSLQRIFHVGPRLAAGRQCGPAFFPSLLHAPALHCCVVSMSCPLAAP
jgi:hypothetical protein